MSKIIHGGLYIDTLDRGYKDVLAVDCFDNLFIVDTEIGIKTEWSFYIGQNVLGSMSNDDGDSFNYYIKVLEMKRVKSTGNYRVKMEIDGDLCPDKAYWFLLLSHKGDILKKCRGN